MVRQKKKDDDGAWIHSSSASVHSLRENLYIDEVHVINLSLLDESIEKLCILGTVQLNRER